MRKVEREEGAMGRKENYFQGWRRGEEERNKIRTEKKEERGLRLNYGEGGKKKKGKRERSIFFNIGSLPI